MPARERVLSGPSARLLPRDALADCTSCRCPGQLRMFKMIHQVKWDELENMAATVKTFTHAMQAEEARDTQHGQRA